MKRLLPIAALALCAADGPDLSQGGPIDITSQYADYQQSAQIAVARGNAHATRGTTTVIADQLTAHFRKKAGATPVAAGSGDGSGDGTGAMEVYRLDADGNVTINTSTDIAWGDKAVYDIDQAVLVMTGAHLRLKTPTEVITARDRLEYWSKQRLSVARGDALVVGNDGRSVQADILAAYSDPSPTAPAGKSVAKSSPKSGPEPSNGDIDSGQLRRVDGFGHVVVRTQTDIVDGDKGVYLPQTGLARVVGDVTITHGLSVLRGRDAIVNMKTGIAHLLPGGQGPVQGLLVPNDHSTDQPAAATPHQK